ncbi:MAG: 16S rRNA (adenine(1518)-N(6)/adenine(1519)-N(6))-dimethyltransferase RsmA [Actinomycetota bacterium]
MRDLAARHEIRPSRSLGQNFLIDPNLARRIASLASVEPTERIVEVGAGLGSLTLALAGTGAQVTAIEFDRALLPALQEVVGDLDNVKIIEADATSLDWRALLGSTRWILCANLPYNVATPLLLDLLADAPQIRDYLVMVQREVGERLVAGPGDAAVGAVSLKVAYRAQAKIERRVPPTVFWPAPKVGSVLVRLTPRDLPPRGTQDLLAEELFATIDGSFAQRRKTMRNAVRRLAPIDASEANALLERANVRPQARPEELDLDAFARITRELRGGASRGGGGRA